MQRWLPVLLVAVWLAPSGTRPRAAEAVRHAVSVGAGLRAEAIREDLVVPLGFAGPGLRLASGYDGWLGPGLVRARADLGFSFLWNRWGHLAGSLDPSLELSWTARVFWGTRFSLALGPVVVVDSRVNYLYAWDDAHAYWLGAEWVGPQARLAFPLGAAWQVEGTASLALVGLAGRPPARRFNKQDALNHVGFFFRRPLEDQGFVSPWELQALRLELAAHRSPYRGPAVLGGWAFGAELRVARVDFPALNLNLSLCLHARRAFAW
jgi:hypothetical protein